jgi:putative SOS response-associated peptidase YedK
VDILEIGEQTGLHRRLWLLHHQANADVAPIHPKAMPVILTTLRGARRLVARAVDKAEQLQWLLPNHALKIVARGTKQDAAP